MQLAGGEVNGGKSRNHERATEEDRGRQRKTENTEAEQVEGAELESLAGYNHSVRLSRMPIIPVLCSLFLVAQIALWARSHIACDTVGWENTRWHNLALQTRAFGLQSDTG